MKGFIWAAAFMVGTAIVGSGKVEAQPRLPEPSQLSMARLAAEPFESKGYEMVCRSVFAPEAHAWLTELHIDGGHDIPNEDEMNGYLALATPHGELVSYEPIWYFGMLWGVKVVAFTTESCRSIG
jgi:hypothetical protein